MQPLHTLPGTLNMRSTPRNRVVFSKRAHQILRVLLPTAALAVYSTAAQPAIYKCKDGAGNIVYSSTKCPTAEADITPDIVKRLPIGGRGGQSGDLPRRGASRKLPPASGGDPGAGAAPPL